VAEPSSSKRLLLAVCAAPRRLSRSSGRRSICACLAGARGAWRSSARSTAGEIRLAGNRFMLLAAVAAASSWVQKGKQALLPRSTSHAPFMLSEHTVEGDHGAAAQEGGLARD